MKGSKMKIRRLKCNDVIESKHVHDLQKCKCGASFIDGGDKHTRIGEDLKYIINLAKNKTTSFMGARRIARIINARLAKKR